jgi:serine/threonine protein kinase
MADPRADTEVQELQIPHVPAEVKLEHIRIKKQGNKSVCFVMRKKKRKAILAQLKDKPPGLYGKKELDSPFRVVKDANGQCYAIYYGMAKGGIAGAGGQAVVKYVQNLATGDWRVMKMFSEKHKKSKDQEAEKRDLATIKDWAKVEFEKLKKAGLIEEGNKPIVRTSKTKGEQIAIITDEAPGMDFDNVYKEKQSVSFSASCWLNIFESFITQVQALHARSILHCDLNPGNVRYQARDETLRIIDFGAARGISEEPDKEYHLNRDEDPFGAQMIMPTEAARYRTYNTGSDAYAIGITMACIMKIGEYRAFQPFKFTPYDKLQNNPLFRNNEAFYHAMVNLCRELKGDQWERRDLESAKRSVQAIQSRLNDDGKIKVVNLADYDTPEKLNAELARLREFNEIIIIDTKSDRKPKDRLAYVKMLERSGLKIYPNIYVGKSSELVQSKIISKIEYKLAIANAELLKIVSDNENHAVKLRSMVDRLSHVDHRPLKELVRNICDIIDKPQFTYTEKRNAIIEKITLVQKYLTMLEKTAPKDLDN